MTRIGGCVVAAAVAVLSGTLFTQSVLAQALPGDQGDVVFTPPPDAPTGGDGTLGIRQYNSNSNTVCCESPNNSYNNRRPDAAIRLITTPAAQASFQDATRPYLNFREDGGCCDGAFGQSDGRVRVDEQPRVGTQDANFVTLTQGTLRIPTAGDYTFGVNSDDSFLLAFPIPGGVRPFAEAGGQNLNQAHGTRLVGYNGTANGALIYASGRGADNSFGLINLPAGDHRFVLVHEEGGGGDNLEFFAAPGNQMSNLNVRTNGAFNLAGGPPRGEVPEMSTQVQRKLQTVGAWDFVEIHNQTNSVNELFTQYNNNNPSGTFTRTSQPTVNFHDPQGSNTGNHSPVRVFPGDTAGDDNNFGAVARAPLTITGGDAGRYSFLVYTDDGYRFRVLDGAGNPIALAGTAIGATPADTNGDTVNDAIFENTNCCSDRIAKYDLAQGTYTLEAAFNEQGGGAGFFVYGAFGDHNGFGPQFQLAGENLNDMVTNITQQFVAARGQGLQLVPEPTGLALLGFGAVGLLARRRRTA
jgi:hypothetical protein